MNNLRSDLYYALAEALAEPPGWMALPGSQWPLYKIAVRADAGLPSGFNAARSAARSIMEIGAETWKERKARYAALINQIDPTCYCFYESGALIGKLLGPITFEVENEYRQAGLRMVGAEMADHVSLELAFLGRLAEVGASEKPQPDEQSFLQRHAGRWLPALGKAIAASGDPVYAPVGRLLADWLEEAVQQPRKGAHALAVKNKRASDARRLPFIEQVENCTLCGFCVQACREGALTVQEDAGGSGGRAMTRLLFSAGQCTGCGRCTRFCEAGALQMMAVRIDALHKEGWISLCESPRGVCAACGATLISQAELAYVAGRLGNPAWLAYCPDCRPLYPAGDND